ncbi:MAG: purine-nucleoside phosphorylase [Candidatus Saganbacteria bacterium]|nr:purine-nucleoside phosphorylase [Candidatus Saganbacteria bacterium]
MASLIGLTKPFLEAVYKKENGDPLKWRYKCAFKILHVLGLNDNEIKRMFGVLHAFAISNLRPWEKVRGLAREFIRAQETLVEMEKIQVAMDYIQRRIGKRKPEIVLTLGSGLGGLADQIEDAVIIPYDEIPCFPRVHDHVKGHKGNLVVGTLEGKTVAAMQGRFHLFQGVTAMEAVRPLRTLAVLGATQFFVTNAAGAIKPEKFKVGDLMLISDSYNMTGQNPLVGPNLSLGTRFPAMSKAFSPGLHMEIKLLAAKELRIDLQEGTYVQVLGPNYEWDMEVEDMKRRGIIDAVGMSTAIEVLAAIHAGMQVIGVTLITNVAAGLSDVTPEHGEVEDVAIKNAPRFQSLMRLLVCRAHELKSGIISMA